jgi:hypothetical protein
MALAAIQHFKFDTKCERIARHEDGKNRLDELSKSCQPRFVEGSDASLYQSAVLSLTPKDYPSQSPERFH